MKISKSLVVFLLLITVYLSGCTHLNEKIKPSDSINESKPSPTYVTPKITVKELYTPKIIKESKIKAIYSDLLDTVLLTTDGTLWTWSNSDGDKTPHIYKVKDIKNIQTINSYNQFALIDGNGEVYGSWQYFFDDYPEEGPNSLFPYKANGLSDIVSISAGSEFMLALKKDGTLWTWGGEILGDGTTNEATNEPQIIEGLSNIIQITTGGWTAHALDKEGNLWGWGDNRHGQIGDGTQEDRVVPVKINGLTNIKYISEGGSYVLALDSDGNVWQWGDNQECKGSNLPQKVETLSNIVSVYAGWSNTLALQDNGTVWQWGYTGSADGLHITRDKPAQVKGISNIIAIYGGWGRSYAVDANGKLYGWDDKTPERSDTPVENINIPEVISIAGVSD